MKPIQILLLSFLIVPFVEIYLLLQVGGLIGAFPTIFLVVASAVLGAWLLRSQGFATWRRLQDNLQQGVMPAYEIIEGAILLVGGALLLTPGFFTDALGFVCLIPALRRKLAQYIIDHHLLTAVGGSVFKQANSHGDVIEGQYKKGE